MSQPEPPSGVGPCARILDEEQELVCNRPGDDEVLVRNRFGLFAVSLCKDCKEQHRKFYRANRSRLVRESQHKKASQSRGRQRVNNSARQA